MDREKLVRRLPLPYYGKDGTSREYLEDMADFILSDRKAVLERINKALTQLHEEAHDGIKDDYCYIHEIDAAFSEIDRAIDRPIC